MQSSSKRRDPMAETSRYDLESEAVRLNDIIQHVKDSNYSIPATSDRLKVLKSLQDGGYRLLQAVDKEKTKLAQRELKAKIRRMHSEHESELEEEKEKNLCQLEKEKEKNLCQICLLRDRDTVVLTCMHYLYCGECLDDHKQRSLKCPTCRGAICGLYKLNA
ncbi:hypothetical protein R1flu_013335 [Riccia fluitans]|uniref:RING-type domain-containing protein n=1 Tax=Riccia fluitans TaxID=41844 RepID=A0ABD1YE44_9MARC